jgi:hypothetical protein
VTQNVQKNVVSTYCFISINLYHVANISGIFRVSYKKSLLVLKMYAHSYRASNRIKLHHALVMTHAVTRYNTSRLSSRTKNQASYESSPPWEADALYKTGKAMYVCHTTARSRNVCTFSAILTTWYSFTQRQHFYDINILGPLLVTHCGGKSFCVSVGSMKYIAHLRQECLWYFWVIRTERNVCRCAFNRYSVITRGPGVG